MNSIQILALSYLMTWEDQERFDAEIRRDRMILAAAQPENSRKIFDTFKTKNERKQALYNQKKMDAPSADMLDGVPETEDEGLRSLFKQITSMGYAVEEI